MFFNLRDNIEYCVDSGEVILLDVERGRYLTLAPHCRDAFLRLVEGRGCAAEEDRGALETLRRPGYLVEDSQSVWTNRAPGMDMAQEDLDLPQGLKFRLPLLLSVIIAQLVFAARLRVSSFLVVIEYIRRLEAGILARSADADRVIQSVVNAFEASSFLLGRTDRCLVRSLAMLSTAQ